MVMALVASLLLATPFVTPAQDPQVITIRAGRLLDGRGGSQQNVVVRVDGGKIVSVGKASGPVTHDLSKYTLLPGFIDTHVHIGWHFGKDGRFDNTGETPDDRLKAGDRERARHGRQRVHDRPESRRSRRPRVRDALEEGRPARARGS